MRAMLGFSRKMNERSIEGPWLVGDRDRALLFLVSEGTSCPRYDNITLSGTPLRLPVPRKGVEEAKEIKGKKKTIKWQNFRDHRQNKSLRPSISEFQVGILPVGILEVLREIPVQSLNARARRRDSSGLSAFWNPPNLESAFLRPNTCLAL